MQKKWQMNAREYQIQCMERGGTARGPGSEPKALQKKEKV
jgi:hypothetical protein